MGEMVTFASNGTQGSGYLATPASGQGPGVVVIQEWWGLVPHICDLADRFAAEGFTALAPDLYRGESASNTEPDEAGKLMMALDIERATKDMSGAVDRLVSITGRAKIGVVGFCMGGGLTLKLAADRPDAVAAAVPFYGAIPWPAVQPDYTRFTAAVLGHYAENDDWASPAVARELEATLTAAGKQATVHIYSGTQHAFANDTRPEVYDAEAAALAFSRTFEFLRQQL
ncbi:MAG: dienelactone hydrolase family protein [Acidimicrobiia bacterium]